MKMIKVDDVIEYCENDIPPLRAVGQSVAVAALRRVIAVAKEYAIEAEPVKHGVWCKDEQGYDVYVECRECGLNLSVSNYIENEWREILKYCPCCGARMDGGKK